MENIMIIVILLLIVGFSGRYVYKAKKNGRKCIGCPEGGTCGKCQCSGGSKQK